MAERILLHVFLMSQKRQSHENSRTLVASIFHQPAGDADDVLEHRFRQVFEHHLLLDLQLLVHTDGIQDEDGGNGFAVAGQEAAELCFQQLFAFLKACFLHKDVSVSVIIMKEAESKPGCFFTGVKRSYCTTVLSSGLSGLLS